MGLEVLKPLQQKAAEVVKSEKAVTQSLKPG